MWGNILLLLFIGVVIYMMMKSGGCCGSNDHHGGHGDYEGHGDTGRDDVTGHARQHMDTEQAASTSPDKDPVCGMNVHDHGIESNYLGRTFHFCSEQCRKLFDLNPRKYAGA